MQESNRALRDHVKQVLESERAQRQSEQRLRAIANNLPAMIGYWNRDLRCEFANEAYRGWFNLAPDAIIGMRMQDLMSPTQFKLNAPHVHRALAGQAQRFERTLAKTDGSSSIVDVQYLPDLTESEVRGFFVLTSDVTAFRAAQIALEASNSKLAHDSVTDYLT